VGGAGKQIGDRDVRIAAPAHLDPRDLRATEGIPGGRFGLDERARLPAQQAVWAQVNEICRPVRAVEEGGRVVLDEGSFENRTRALILLTKFEPKTSPAT
jgi:hypothetical protein